jgi:hypothetical protein
MQNYQRTVQYPSNMPQIVFNPFCSHEQITSKHNHLLTNQTLWHGQIYQYTPVISFLARHLSNYITKQNSLWKGLWHFAQGVGIPNWQRKKSCMSKFYETASWKLHLHFTYFKVFLNSFQVNVAVAAMEWQVTNFSYYHVHIATSCHHLFRLILPHTQGKLMHSTIQLYTYSCATKDY